MDTQEQVETFDLNAPVKVEPVPETPPALEVMEYATPAAQLFDRPLILPADPESRIKRWGFLLLALVILFLPATKIKSVPLPGGYLSWLMTYCAPAHPGVDQNGYQVGGKLFAETFTTGAIPPSPYSYVGWMWVMTKDGWYYPKYPLGLPVIDAVLIWIGGKERGVEWAYSVSPVSVSLSLLAMFFMVRLAAGSFAGIIGMILLGMSPATLILANNSNSHAPSLVFVCWGMLFLIWWWQYGSWWRGLIAGLLLGYAVTIRYTEGLLLLPLVFACLTRVRWTSAKSWMRVSWPLIGWMIPCVLLVGFNLAAMGTITGYDTTNESTGFSWDNFNEKWQYMLAEMHDIGLYFVLPLALLGLLLLMRWSWRLGLFMLLWFVPGTLLYTSYYWGLNTPGVAYLRFFLTIFPPAIIAVAWLMHFAERRLDEVPVRARRQIATVVLCAVVIVGSTFVIHQLGLRTPTTEEIAALGNAMIERLSWPTCIAFATVVSLIPACILGAGAGVTRPIAAGVVVAIASGVGTYQNIGGLERDFTINTNLAFLGDNILSQTRRVTSYGRPLLFADGRQLLNYLQFRGDYECYSPDAFTMRGGRQLIRKEDQDAPNPLQAARIEKAKELYEKKTDADLQKEAEKTITTALRGNRKVFAIVTKTDREWFRKTFVTPSLTSVKLESWRDPVAMSPAAKSALNNMGAARWWLGYGEKREWEIWEIRLK